MAAKPKARPQSKRKRRGAELRRKRGGGVMTGMRSGFKNVAKSVTGAGESDSSKNAKSSWLNTAITVVLVVAVGALLFYRFR